jgi:predicted metal-dependent peptidase
MPVEPPTPEELAHANTVRVLKLVAATLPHLSGLCHSVRIKMTKKYPVAAIGASGLMLVNPRVFSETPLPDLVFVVAHELMHLALDTFGRSGNADPYLTNVAHDYVINDILSTELGREVPLGGLVRHGARNESLEAIVAELARNGEDGNPKGCWSIERKKKRKKRVKKPKTAMQEELERAGLLPPEPEEEAEPEDDEPDEYPGGDALSEEQEEEHEPELGPKERSAKCERVRREAVRAVSLKELRAEMEGGGHGGGPGDPGATRTLMEAVATAYQPPWQLALQHWLDAVSPGPRSYAKASRRGADRDDGVILAGRKREGWALHVVMDTSGSMVDTLPRILGLLASFCESAGVDQVHIMQCDVGVTSDEWLDPAELMSYKVTGFGGSDMSPAMNELADDPEVNAVLVLTDGYIDYPREEPPYNVLWGLVDGDPNFTPLYGTVVHVRT